MKRKASPDQSSMNTERSEKGRDVSLARRYGAIRLPAVAAATRYQDAPRDAGLEATKARTAKDKVRNEEDE